LVQAGDGVFYGTTSSGGTNNAGSVFSITSAGTFTPVMSFMGGYDGNDPTTPLVQVPSGIFYGTTYQGGKAGDGVIFEVTTNGVLTPIYSFTNGLDGAFPAAGLTYGIDGNLYGTSFTGGAYNSGVLFKMTPGVGTLTVLNSFTNFSSAVRPMGRLVQGTNGNFYGTTSGGGFPGYPYFGTGTVFEMAPEGELTELYPFTNGVDGGNPEAGLVQGADGNFYGTTTSGGIPRTDRPVNTFGTIYKITPRGAFTPLYTFTNGADGAYPHCQLIQWSDGNFYGTAPSGGSNGYGTIFEITPSGSFTPLYSFTNGIDGATPDAGLVPGPGGNLYGTASSGGTYGMGTIFEFTTNRNLTPLYSFMGTNDGELPVAPLALGSDGNFYGTASLGGEADAGTVFKVELSTLAAPQFNSIVVGSGSITVSWTTVVGQMYQLQVASNLALFNWSNVSTPQTGTGGSLTYADGDIGNNQRYYRVSTYSP
jgi:uncharacterized repeat protein (TIGR03803 family)